MNRIIKFRVWDGKEMRFPPPLGEWDDSDQYHFFSYNKKPSVIMQFTGLKDKNGKEIWEGDIVVKSGYLWFDEGKPNYRGTVEWIYSQWQVVAHCVNSEKRGISDGANEGLNDDGVEEGNKSEWKVIGNIYENPELVK